MGEASHIQTEEKKGSDGFSRNNFHLIPDISITQQKTFLFPLPNS